MLEIVFIGLCMLVTEGKSRVVIPDLTQGTAFGAENIEAHVAYIEVAANDVVSCDGCRDHQGNKLFPLQGDELTLASGVGRDFEVDADYRDVVPHMSRQCQPFRLKEPAGATTMALTHGTLKPRKQGDERRSVLELDKTGGNITFRAKRGGVERALVLKPETKRITIANRYANYFNGKPPAKHNHWLAFYTLSEAAVPDCRLPKGSASSRKPHVHAGYETTIACSNSGYP